MRAIPPTRASPQVMETNHAFNDHRIALEAAVVRWTTALLLK
jgi:hypothetical protein